VNKPPNPEGNTYVLGSVQPPQRGFPAVTLLLAFALLALGWFGHDFYVQDTVSPTVVPTAVITPEATTVPPDVAESVIAELQAIWTPTPTPTLVPTLAPTATRTIEEEKFLVLPYCNNLSPDDPPQECILFNPLIPPTPTIVPTQTAVPTCPKDPIRSSIQSICVHDPTLVDKVIISPWR
jgi:hypothetical protein